MLLSRIMVSKDCRGALQIAVSAPMTKFVAVVAMIATVANR